MKILIVNTFYYPNMPGGSEQSVKLLAEKLVKKGHRVAIYCIDSKDNESRIEEYNGVKVYRRVSQNFNLYKFSYEKDKINRIEKIVQKLFCYYNKKCVLDFEKVCKDFKPDLIHTNSTYGITKCIWKKAYEMSIPIIHTIRDMAMISPVQYGHKVSKIVEKLHQLYNVHYSKYVSAVTAPSEYTLRTTLEIGTFKNTKIKECIFNSVSIDYKNLNRILAEKEKRESTTIKFMYAGRLVYFKGIEHMIEAFEMISEENCELHICGLGDMQQFVEEWAKKDSRIIYHGKLKNEDLAKCYEECDVLLVPSYWPEPFGRVLIEGNMYGLPTIVGDCGGMPEILNITKSGVTYIPKDKNDLALKMTKMLDRNTIKKYFDNIRNNIDAYEIRHQIEKFEEIYREISLNI